MIRTRLALVVSLAALAARPARAQETTGEPGVAAEPQAPAPSLHGVLATSGLFYREQAANVLPGVRQSSPEDLAFADLRARLEIANVARGPWGALGDFRLRATGDDLSARGFDGGGEYHLREAFLVRRGRRVSLSFGRLVVREVDAVRVDGASLRYQPAAGSWHYGAFVGLYPNPLSRSLDTDYERGDLGSSPPAAGGVWTGYETERNHGAFGAGGIAPREAAETSPRDEPRVFAASSGYHVLGGRLDGFHHAVVDLAGPGGAALLSGMLGATWRATDRWRFEASAAHMSTHAVELYVRDLLEQPDPDPQTGAPVQNNLTLVRVASDEGRLGVVLDLPARVGIDGGVRLRRRDALSDAELPAEIAALRPDTQLDLSAGLRQRDSLLGLDLALAAIFIRGDRTASRFLTLRVRRQLVAGRLSTELEAGAIDYADRCEPDDPTCTGDLDGRTWRAGAQLVALPAARWLFLADYRFALNQAERAGMEQPDIRSHTVYLRAQRSF